VYLRVLHEFLSANRVAIVERTRAKLRAREGGSAREEELAGSISLFLDRLIDALRPSQPSGSAVAERAAERGRELLNRGFTVAQVLHEYGDLCEAITELGIVANVPVSASDFHLFNQCFHGAVGGAMNESTRGRDRSVADEGRARLEDLSHELRDTLGAAAISFEVIKKGNVGLRGSTAALHDRSLRRAIALVESSVAQVRLDSGVRSPERVYVHQFIEEVEVGAFIEATARGLTLAVTPVEPGIEVHVDRPLLAAAVGNLLQNAFKFTRPNSQVSLKTSSTSARVLIEVEDQCGGLPVEVSADPFRRFAQRGRDRTGLGIGLSICRKSVERDGGEVRVRDMPGVGCVFVIDLPRHQLAP
jgi:signal transduction histidine kinase